MRRRIAFVSFLCIFLVMSGCVGKDIDNNINNPKTENIYVEDDEDEAVSTENVEESDKENKSITEAVATSTEEIVTEDKTTEEVVQTGKDTKYKDYYLIDYSILAKQIWKQLPDGGNYDDVIAGCEEFDMDHDGKKELYISRTNAQSGISYESYGITDFHKPVIAIYTDCSAAGSSKILIDNSTDVLYLNKDYCSVMNFYNEFYKLTEDGWYMFAYESKTNSPENDPTVTNIQFDQIEYNFKGESISEEEFNNIDMINGDCHMLKNDRNAIMKFEINDTIIDVEYSFSGHLGRFDCPFKSYKYDLNNDGRQDVLFVVNDYTKKWIENIKLAQYSTSGYEAFNGADNIPQGTSVVVLEENNGRTTIRTAVLDARLDIDSIRFDDGIIATDAYGNDIKYIYTPDEDNTLSVSKN